MKSLWGQNNSYLRVKKPSGLSPRVARALFFGAIGVVFVVFIAGDVGLWKLWKAQRELKSLRARIEELEKRNALLREEIKRLESDPFAIEKVAREKYGYLREGDRVYRLVNPSEMSEVDILFAPSSLDRIPLKR